MNIKEHFLSKLKIGDIIGCWEFPNNSEKGYGSFVVNRKKWFAHRFAWHLLVGPIPEGMFVCHKCDNPKCCNPSHLFLGTCKQNQEDMVKKGRSCSGVKQHSHKVTEKDVLEIRGLYSPGFNTYKEIGNKYGLSDVAVRLMVIGKTWKHIPGAYLPPKIPARGERIKNSKINAEIVAQIKHMLARGHSQSETARLLGLGFFTVHHVATGRCWKHIL